MTAGLGPQGRQSIRDRLRLAACRIFIALSAGLLVTAFAVAALAPQGLSLEGGLRLLAVDQLASLKRIAPASSPDEWNALISAFLARPAWLFPAMTGLISLGVALTLRRPQPHKSGRR